MGKHRIRAHKHRPALWLVQNPQYGPQAVLEIPLSALHPVDSDCSRSVLLYVPREDLLEWADRLAAVVEQGDATRPA